MESVRTAPILPPELERQIYEICALSRPVLIPKLMLVAWRAKEWCVVDFIFNKPNLIFACSGWNRFCIVQLQLTAYQ
ncbi:hypothetical protein C8R44DRAFT_121208 [Mycena epipterygia]|nr:hypothetical protein C8R44DRAFT_121208 [Mycena epipterygia]